MRNHHTGLLEQRLRTEVEEAGLLSQSFNSSIHEDSDSLNNHSLEDEYFEGRNPNTNDIFVQDLETVLNNPQSSTPKVQAGDKGKRWIGIDAQMVREKVIDGIILDKRKEQKSKS